MGALAYAALKDLTLVMDAVPISDSYLISWSRVTLITQARSRYYYFSLFSEGKIKFTVC